MTSASANAARRFLSEGCKAEACIWHNQSEHHSQSPCSSGSCRNGARSIFKRFATANAVFGPTQHLNRGLSRSPAADSRVSSCSDTSEVICRDRGHRKQCCQGDVQSHTHTDHCQQLCNMKILHTAIHMARCISQASPYICCHAPRTSCRQTQCQTVGVGHPWQSPASSRCSTVAPV